MLRPYKEQRSIVDFEKLSYQQRKTQVSNLRKIEIFRLQRANNLKLLKQTKKNYRKTEAYIHLTYEERKNLVLSLAECIANWGFARVFAEFINKIYFDPNRVDHDIDEQAFEQLVSRFEQYLQNISRGSGTDYLGMLVHDNNSTIEKKHTYGEWHGFGKAEKLWPLDQYKTNIGTLNSNKINLSDGSMSFQGSGPLKGPLSEAMSD